MSSTLILGGARSGKSTMAQEMALEAGGGVLFVATAEAGDEDMRVRIEAHQQSRPDGWTTLETASGLGPQITQHIGGIKTVIVDCITLLVSNIFQENDWREEPELLDKAVREEINGLIASMEASGAHFIIVSNEVGLGIVPA
ncbi:MAG: bifunctional adenosylcobinamide kinase/adenosylcobinamide-phosphate guanylyltransferase, partial [Dehalococcoidales bacterium]|nr:bifunctional adenosylcobinamide kinase/adenosylcobinamide-phosphate guanylyltransferase [Dehalococcoidales bacterium]